MHPVTQHSVALAIQQRIPSVVMAVGLACVLLTPPSHASGAVVACAQRHQTGAWLTVDSPFTATSVEPISGDPRSEFGWDGELSTTAIDPRDAARMFATDGVNVERSTDGGCTWASVFTTGVQGHDDPAPYIVSRIVIASSGSAGRVYLLLQENSASSRVQYFDRVAVSTNGGGTFSVIGGMSTTPPGTSTPERSCATNSGDYYTLGIAAAPSSPNTVYLVCNTSPSPALFVSTDSGQHWSQIPSAGLPFWAYYSPFTIAPTSPKSLWFSAIDGRVANNVGVWNSNDGGRTFNEVYKFPQPAAGQESGEVTISAYLPPKTKPTGLQVAALNESGLALSVNAGKSWTLLPAPAFPAGEAGPYLSAAFGPRPGSITVITGYGATASYYTGKSPNPTPSCGEGTLAWSYSIAKKKWTSIGAPSISPTPGGYALAGLTPSSGGLYGFEPGYGSPCVAGVAVDSPHIIAYTGS